MRIAIIGYGKMGKTIERIAEDRGHEIILRIDSKNVNSFSVNRLRTIAPDMAIEFTGPETAFQNITTCFEAGVKVVCGSTAWLSRWNEALTFMNSKNGSFIYASNFSIGVNIFFALNKKLANLMVGHHQYTPSISEIHHTAKLDAPSGTAITLANSIIDGLPSINGWSFEPKNENFMKMTSIRQDPAPGTHKITYTSEIDDIEITHTAKSRNGFALGAVMAAEYLMDKTGLHTMEDVLRL